MAHHVDFAPTKEHVDRQCYMMDPATSNSPHYASLRTLTSMRVTSDLGNA